MRKPVFPLKAIQPSWYYCMKPYRLFFPWQVALETFWYMDVMAIEMLETEINQLDYQLEVWALLYGNKSDWNPNLCISNLYSYFSKIYGLTQTNLTCSIEYFKCAFK